MAKHLVNLDALILREDFQVLSNEPIPATMRPSFSISDLNQTGFIYPALRKPDFQRETANWTPSRVAEFVESFLGGDLIPSLILWRSPQSGNIFVIDGAHRLSALLAWIHDDYGDKEISTSFYGGHISPIQLTAAEMTRRLVAKAVGSYAEIVRAGQNQSYSKPEHVRRAKDLGTFSINVQWVTGDAKKAEASFFNINQKATPIDATELTMIQSRNKPNALAARAIVRAGAGHKYWSAFSEDVRKTIEKFAKEIYASLFTPDMEPPVKSLDLSMAGRGNTPESLRLVFDLVNLVNGLTKDSKFKELKSDEDGTQTLLFLKRVQVITNRISSESFSGSLGLHPAIYFYSRGGRIKPASLLATVRFVEQLEATNGF